MTNPLTTRRLNLRAVAVLAALALTLGAALIALSMNRAGRIGDAATRQIGGLVERGQVELALRHLDRYLAETPDDEAMLHLQARLLADRAAGIPELDRVARLHDRLLRQYPNNAEADAVRARLADLYIRLSDAHRSNYDLLGDPELAAFEYRYRAAAEIAHALIDRRGDDPEAHVLLGRALEGLAGPGTRREMDQAISAYGRALALHEAAARRDPGDEASARGAADVAIRLARLHDDYRDDPEAAEEVLRRLVSARPDSTIPRLARYRYYRGRRDARRAAEELHALLRLAPEDPEVRLAAADHALQRGDPTAARDHLEAIPQAEGRDRELRLRLVDGLIDLAERREPQAIDRWREGLVMVHGADAELTWWLAYVQLRLGQLKEADLMIGRYRSLSGGVDSPSLRLLLALRDEQAGQVNAAIRALEGLRGDVRVAETIRVQATVALGRCYRAIGDLAAAERIYRLASQADPRSMEPILEQARLMQEAGRAEEAALMLEAAIDERAADDPALRIRVAGLRLAAQLKLPEAARSWAAFDRAAARAEEAVRIAAEAEGVDPSSVDLTLIIAVREAAAGDLDGADGRLVEALERWPENPQLWATRAELRRTAGRPGEAIALIEAGLERAGDDARLRLLLARDLVALGRGREAQRRLVQGADRLEADQRAALYEALGRLHVAHTEFDLADEAFKAWSALQPSKPQPVLARIEVALLRGQVDRARALLDDFGRVGAVRDGLLYRLAGASIDLRRADLDLSLGQAERNKLLLDALEVVGGVLAEAKELGEAHLLAGRLNEGLGRADQALAAYRQAWKRDQAEALPRLTDLLARLGRFAELQELIASSGSAPGSAEAVGRLSAQALLAVGQTDRVAELLDEAVTDPTAAQAWRTRLLELAGRTDELEGLLRSSAQRAGPDDAAPWIDLVAAQSRLGRDRAAMDQTIRQALDHARGLPRPLLEAQLRWASGDLQGADAVLGPALGETIVDPELMVGAAVFYSDTGRPELAEPLLERLLQNDQAAGVAALQLAVQLSARAAGDPETWRRAVELVGDGEGDPERRLARAIVLARAPEAGPREEAIPLFKGLMADLPVMHPQAVEARKQLAGLLVRLGRPERAAEVTAVSASQPAAAPEAIALHARVLLQAGRHAEVGAELDRLELLRPGDQEAAELRASQLFAVSGGSGPLEQEAIDRLGIPGGDLFARAACRRLLAEGTTEAAEAASRIAERLGELSPPRLWVSVLALAALGRHQEARERCLRASGTINLADELDRAGLVDAVLATVQVTPAAGRVAAVEAVRPVIDGMLAKRPGDPNLLLASAILCHQSGEYQAEADLYREVLRSRPGNDLAQYNLALALSEGLDRPEEGLEQIDRLAARLGPSASVLGARGVILTRLGRFDEAIRDLERSVALEPTADRHYFLARAYHRAGRAEPFREHIEQARRAGLDPDIFDLAHRDEVRQLLAL